jgi:ABC-2 type transport system ATP-binding protein
VEIGAASQSTLFTLFDKYPNVLNKKLNGEYLQLYLQLGTANLEAINKHCFDNGITLNHLLLKKKSLEAKFFELTN